MKKFLVEDFIVGISKGGLACGPVSGHVVAELCLRNAEDNSLTYHSLTEYEGTLNFTEGNKSIFDILINENFEDTSALTVIEGSYAGSYANYTEFYVDMDTCDDYHRLVWKLLAFLVRARWVELDQVKARCIGQPLEDIEIPICDVEQEYSEDLAEDSFEAIRDEYVGLQVNIGLFDFKEGESPEGDYTFEETVQSKDGNEYKCMLGFDLDDDGIIKYIPRIRCKKRQDNSTFVDTDFIPAEAYERLRDELNSMM